MLYTSTITKETTVIKERDCEVCGKCMGYCTAQRKTCSEKCRKAKSRKLKKEKKDA